MIHWGFLFLAFIVGFASCYGLIYQLTKVAGRIESAIEAGSKAFRI